ncbi:keratin-associated protein 24-1 [Oryctolagus cuniculus]|uniref:keratin-associated protein 24-1 n=1 Tax=Oryctolagus cuniculus TaxID=9986 RepID=UPI003879CDF7
MEISKHTIREVATSIWPSTERRKRERLLGIPRKDINVLWPQPYHNCPANTDMQSGTMSFLGYPAFGGATSYRTHCYIPVTTSAPLSSEVVSPAFELCLPSSCQGDLWLLDQSQESYCEVPSCKSPSCEPKTCDTSCDPPNSCGPCNSPSAGQVITACEITNIRPTPSCCPGTQAKGYVSRCYPLTQYASKGCQTLRHFSTSLGQLNYSHKSLWPLNYCGLENSGVRSYQNRGFVPSSFSPSCYIASSYQPQSYLVRNCRYPSYGLTRRQPLSCLRRNLPSLSCVPSTFPPLRYLCSGSRPLNCY